MADDGQENRLIAERRAKLKRLREAGDAYPNDFHRNALADELLAAYQSHSAESLAASPVEVRVAGRLMVKRVMGGTSFVKLQDRSGQIQLMLKRDRIGEALYGEFKKWDVGDIVAARGELIKTKTGELSIDVGELRLLVKSLRPLPEKWHGITDAEMKLRQRYVEAGDWWETTGLPGLQDKADLPADLLDGFKQIASNDSPVRAEGATGSKAAA